MALSAIYIHTQRTEREKERKSLSLSHRQILYGNSLEMNSLRKMLSTVLYAPRDSHSLSHSHFHGIIKSRKTEQKPWQPNNNSILFSKCAPLNSLEWKSTDWRQQDRHNKNIRIQPLLLAHLEKFLIYILLFRQEFETFENFSSNFELTLSQSKGVSKH